jgi:ABC-2 type transport system permease protein
MKLTLAEGKLFVRDPIALFFGLVFPAVLLLALGSFMPGFDEAYDDFGGLRLIDVYAPVTLALGLATLGFVTLPPILATYRQFGILRRLRTTPVQPAQLLWAQLVVHMVVAVLASVAAVVVAVLAFDVVVPEQPLWFVVSFVLAAASVFALGLLVGAIARSTSAGQAIGMATYFPMLFLAGVWVPRDVMPDGLRTVSDLTPLGSGVQAMHDSWFGFTPSATHLGVMLAYAVVVAAVAVRLFRWE